MIRRIINKVIKGYKIFNITSLLLLVGMGAIITLVVTGVFLKAFLETPDFMFHIKDQMVADEKFQNIVGQPNGYSIWFDRAGVEGRDTIPFAISIDGKDDSTFVKITGRYYQDFRGKIIYYKQDTLYKGL